MVKIYIYLNKKNPWKPKSLFFNNTMVKLRKQNRCAWFDWTFGLGNVTADRYLVIILLILKKTIISKEQTKLIKPCR